MLTRPSNVSYRLSRFDDEVDLVDGRERAEPANERAGFGGVHV
jgi:hypothetical protein